MNKCLIIIIILVVLFWLAEHFELKKYTVTHYEASSGKIKNPMRIVVISDLHNHVYGSDNDTLAQSVRQCRPDLILIPGDLITSKTEKSYGVALSLLEQIKDVAPVYYSNGNHESRAKYALDERKERYENYVNRLKAMGIRYLNNESEMILINDNACRITGLEIDLNYYSKGRKVPMGAGYLNETLGDAAGRQFQILLAHSPAFFERYVEWGADFTVSGHMHGGLVRIPGIGSAISPQFQLFPKYDAGLFQEKDSCMAVSKGLGTHTFNIRVFDRAELLCIDINPDKHNLESGT